MMDFHRKIFFLDFFRFRQSFSFRTLPQKNVLFFIFAVLGGCEDDLYISSQQMDRCTVLPTTGLFRTVEPNSPRTVYGLPLYRFDLCYIVYMIRNTIFHHDKVLPLGLLRAYGLPDAP